MSNEEVRLADLRASISEMSDDELRATIGQSRNNRKAPPKPVRVIKAKKTKVKKVKVNPLENVDAMSSDAAALLLAKLLKQ